MPEKVELVKGFSRVADAPKQFEHQEGMDWWCRKGHHGRCPCTRLLLQKTGELTREFKKQGEALTQITGFQHCGCPCHQEWPAGQAALVWAITLVCPIDCTWATRKGAVDAVLKATRV